MIETIDLINYRSSAICKTENRCDMDAFPFVTYQFKKGNVYGLISDFGDGSWGLATCIGGRGSKEYDGKILLNNAEIPPQNLSEYSAFIREKVISKVNFADNLGSARECIQNALKISGLNCSVDDIKSLFKLTDSRFDRTLDCVSGEIWQISMAIQFALGKDIFCFPWLNIREFSRFEGMCEEGIISFLKSENKIILVPTSRKKEAKKLCDRIICFEKKGLRLD